MERSITVQNWFEKGHNINLTCYGGDWCKECAKRFQCWTTNKDEAFVIVYKSDFGITIHDVHPKTEEGGIIGTSPINVAEFILFGDKALTVKRGVWDLGVVHYSSIFRVLDRHNHTLVE